MEDSDQRPTGLYRSSDEHDACGVGFVAHIKGIRSHAIVRDALDLLINLEHRGAAGSDPDTGDGAGILVQMPDRFLRQAVPFALPPQGAYGAGLVFLPTDESRARRPARAGRAHRRGGGPDRPRLAPGEDQPVGHRPERRRGRPGVRAAVHRPQRGPRRAGRRQALRAAAVRDPQAHRARRRPDDAGRRAPAVVLHRQPVVADADLQGHAHGIAARRHVPRPAERGVRLGPGARAPAVLDQHVPVVAARPPVPVRGAQRRDQHPARQRQLDARARGPAAVGRARRRPREDPAGDPPRRQRHGHLRQRARAAGDGGAHASARGADDDPGAVVGEPGHGSGGARLLRVSLVADGAVGRSRLDHLHRRHADRRGPRSQRPAPVALLRDQRRPRDHGLGDGRPGHPGRSHRAEGSPAPRQDAADRHAAGPHHRRRGDQARSRRRASLRGVAAGEPGQHRGRCLRPAPSVPITRPCCGASRRSATRRKTCGCCSRRWRCRARSRWARWAPTRRSPCCRTSRGCSTTTSRSSSRRSPIRRSTRSARSWSRRWAPRSARKATCWKPRPRRAGRSRSTTRSSTTIRSRSSATCRPARRSARRRCRCSTTRTRTDRAWRRRWPSCAARPARRSPPVTAS